jgi:hypothetical protein
MKKLLVIVWIVCLIFSLCAGCVTNTPQVKPEPQSPATVLNITTDKTQADSQLLWITVDPVSNHDAGDVFTITGTTNLSVSDEILVQVIPEWWIQRPSKSQCGGKEIIGQGATGTIVPVPGNNSLNLWNFSINSSTFPSQNYIVSVDGVTRTASAESGFYLGGNNSADIKKGCQ